MWVHAWEMKPLWMYWPRLVGDQNQGSDSVRLLTGLKPQRSHHDKASCGHLASPSLPFLHDTSISVCSFHWVYKPLYGPSCIQEQKSRNLPQCAIMENAQELKLRDLSSLRDRFAIHWGVPCGKRHRRISYWRLSITYCGRHSWDQMFWKKNLYAKKKSRTSSSPKTHIYKMGKIMSPK